MKKISAIFLTFLLTALSVFIPSSAWAVDPFVEPGTIAVGTGPLFIAINSSGTTAYVANYSSDNISVVNLSTGIAGTPISVGNEPTSIAIAPNGTFAYVANFNNDSPSDLTRIELPSGTPTTIMSGGGLDGPESIVFSPDGSKAYVSNQGMTANAKIFVIDTATNTKLSEIAVDPRPQKMVISQDGTKLYVSHFNNDLISFIDLSGGTPTVTTPITGIDGPQGLALGGPNNGLLYVALYGDTTPGTKVNVYNAITGALVTEIPGFSRPFSVTVNPANSQVFVSNQAANQVKIIDIATASVISPTLSVGVKPYDITFAPNGRKAYVANFTSNTLSVISLPEPPQPTPTPTPQPEAETLAQTGSNTTFGFLSAAVLLTLGFSVVLLRRRNG